MGVSQHESHQFPDPQLPIYFPTHARNGCGPQWHKDIELLYCTAGAGTLLCNGIAHTMEPGHIYAINPNELHTALDLGGLFYHVLIIDDDFLLQNSIPTDRIEFKTNICCEKANQLYGEIMHELETRTAYYAPKIRGLLLLLIAVLLESSTKSVPEQIAHLQDPDAPIKAAVDYINRHYAKKLTLDEIAGVAGFTKQYFANRFKKSIGMTVVDYINFVRCRKAKKLLARKQVSVMEAAAQCGFENASYFSKTFRRVMGMLPSQVEQEN